MVTGLLKFDVYRRFKCELLHYVKMYIRHQHNRYLMEKGVGKGRGE